MDALQSLKGRPLQNSIEKPKSGSKGFLGRAVTALNITPYLYYGLEWCYAHLTGRDAPYLPSQQQRAIKCTSVEKNLQPLNLEMLPNEIKDKIIFNLSHSDGVACKQLNSSWNNLVNTGALEARSFYQDHHITCPQFGQGAVKHYELTMRNWFKGLGSTGNKFIDVLDSKKASKFFPKLLFFYTAKVLAEANELQLNIIYKKSCPHSVTHACFSPDENNLVLGCYGFFTIFERNGRKLEKKISFNVGERMPCTQFSPDGSWFFVGADSGAIKVCDLTKGIETTLAEYSEAVKCVDCSYDGKYLFAGVGSCVKIWALEKGEWKVKETLNFDQPINCICPAPDNIHLFIGLGFKRGVVLRRDTGWTVQQELDHGSEVPREEKQYARFSPDSSYLFTALSWRTWHSGAVPFLGLVNIWKWSSKKNEYVKLTYFELEGGVNCLDISSDGARFVAGSSSSTAIIMRLINGSWYKEESLEHSGSVQSAQFGVTSNILITGSMDGYIKIFSLFGGKWRQCDSLKQKDMICLSFILMVHVLSQLGLTQEKCIFLA